MDLKYALRQLAKNPGFAAVAILTLALGIGANTAIFSFVNAWIIQPTPFPKPEQVVILFETDKKTGNSGSVAPADWKDWSEKAGIFEELAAANFNTHNLTGVEEPERIVGFDISANFFRALGMKPALGREFTESEQIPGQDRVVILSHDIWRDRYSSDLNILGRTIMLDGAATTVVGVMPEKFQYIPMGRADMFMPLALSPEAAAARDTRYLRPMGRLKAGIDVRRAVAAMTAFQASLEQAYPLTNTNRGVQIRTLTEEIDRQSGNSAVKIVYWIVCFVLLMACANVANLVMSRATARRKEMAVRLAIGAGRWRLVRQFLGETLILFVAGAAGGVLLARWFVVWILHTIPLRSLPYIPNHGRAEVDWQVLMFTMAVSLVTGILFGLAPALEGTRFDVNVILKDAGARGTGSFAAGRFRKILVAGEMALAVMVVVCAALLVNSFARVRHLDPGFDAEHVVVAELQLPPKYQTPASIAQFYDAAIERLGTMPNVERASAAMFTPFSDGGNTSPLFIEGRPEPPPGQVANSRTNYVTPGFLESMSIPLVDGRTISRQDSMDATPAVVVNETLVKRFFPGENPLGKRIRLSRRKPVWHTIVGVVKDIKYYQFASVPENQVYLAFAQAPTPRMTLVARVHRDPDAVAQSIRAVVRGVDPNQPVARVLTIQTQIDEQFAGDRILTQITGGFGLLALFLAAIGIYGVMTHSVSQRTQEIGVRMALGARSRDVLGLIVRQGMGIVLGGMVVGVAGALGMAKLLDRFLYGVSWSDPVTFIGTFAGLTVVALAACAVPAMRAARVDPLVALRYE